MDCLIRNVLLAVIMLASVVGCGTDAPATNAQLASEIDVLKTGLDAWKSGRPMNSTEFADADWKGGAKLTDYRVLKAGAEDASETVCTVLLKLEVQGKPIERTVAYRITQSPKRSVTRDSGR